MKYIIKTLFILICSVSFSQELSFGERLEFAKDGYGKHKVYTYGLNGLVHRCRSVKDDDQGNRTWMYQIYDTDLGLKSSVDIKLDEDFILNETYVHDGYVCDLFTLTEEQKYQMVTLEVESGKLYKVEGELASSKMTLHQMRVVGDFAYLYTRVDKDPFMMSINWKTGENKLTPIKVDGVKAKRLKLRDIQVLEESDEVFCFMAARLSRKEDEILVIRFDSKGNKKDRFTLKGKEITESLAELSVRRIGKDHYVYTGTYSYTSRDPSSAGLFFTESKNGQRSKEFKFYKFTDLDNFLSYLPENKQEKIKKKKKRKKKKGKELENGYFIADHEIKVVDDGYLFIGEAYYLTHETYTTTKYEYGKRTTVHERRFDGYQYTHAVIGKFNKNGELVWDQTFEMWPPVKPFYPKRFINVFEKNENSLDLAFASRNKIHMMSFGYDGEVLEESQSEEIVTNIEGDEMKQSFAELDYWYGDYFVTYGFQKIKNKELEEGLNKNRRVFYIQKVEF